MNRVLYLVVAGHGVDQGEKIIEGAHVIRGDLAAETQVHMGQVGTAPIEKL